MSSTVGTSLRGTQSIGANRACRQALADHLTAQAAVFSDTPTAAPANKKPKAKAIKDGKALCPLLTLFLCFAWQVKTAEDQQLQDFRKQLKKWHPQCRMQFGVSNPHCLPASITTTGNKARDAAQKLTASGISNQEASVTNVCVNT